MEIKDELYGEFEVAPIIAELIQTETFQRLKDIHMAGAAYLTNPEWNETRYEHSLGVMLLIKKLGGSLEEQLAGLLHDISHTAFSHLADYIFENPQEDYHEQIKEHFLKNSDIENILRKNNLNRDALLFDDSKWRILEQAAPQLCADRLDYTLREVHRYYQVPLNEIHKFLADLEFENGFLFVKSLNQAEWFVDQYHKIVVDFFYDPRNIYGTELLKNILQRALSKNLIVESDFLLSETELLEKLKATGNKEILNELVKISDMPSLISVAGTENYNFSRKNKIRFVDPLVLTNGKLQQASELSDSLAAKINETKQAVAAGVFFKIA